eukprot:280466-Chlamydomonas_euryale.AAC.1
MEGLAHTCTTGQHIATRRKSSTCGESGAPPDTSALTRPPSAALTFENTRRSKNGAACACGRPARRKLSLRE